MSNTSYSFKENSHMKVIQGGEKKVMKKILSVALSTAMAFSMFASVAFGADATKLTPEQQFNVLKDAGIVTGYPDGTAGLDKSITRAELAKVIVKSINLEPITGVATYKDKNYTASHWAAPFIEAATQAGILQGKNLEKKLFDPTGNVTVQELAKVLVAALKLEVPAETNNTATEWAKGYVEAAVKAGYLEAGINYQANATRAQAVVASYAIYEANQVPTVASYVVSEAGKVVEFTLSNKEVVKVTLEKALEANKETEVKFTHNGNDYTHKVTYTTTVAQAVKTVTAENLKQIVVTFDGTVDSVTAGDEDNYSIDGKSFESATVSEDKTSVTLLLSNLTASTLVNQKQTEVSLKNIKNEDSTKTFSQKVQFTPIDVTAPTVKEVVGLGTKALKVKFSEPVKESDAIASVNYRVDGKAIAASVKYAYPDTVIISTNLVEGEHTLRISGVADFSGLSVAPVENKFNAVVDTAAPEIESIKANDLTEVTVTFNETIKSVSSAYANASSRKADKIYINDNKVTLVFATGNRLIQGENSITLTGVSDYSGNSADRDAKVSPVLDTTRPTVNNVDFSKVGLDYVAKIQFSEQLDGVTAAKRDNYKLVDADGKVAKIAGVDSDGHPIRTINYNAVNKTVTINFGPKFDKKYTLEISEIEDDAYIGNEMLPYSVVLDPAGTEEGEIARVWIESAPGTLGKYVYVEFNATIATSGAGSALDPAKYSFDDVTTTTIVERTRLTTKVDDIDPVSTNTIRIYTESAIALNDKLFADYIANSEGEYLTDGDFTLEQTVSNKNQAVAAGDVEATATDSLTVKFNTALNYVNEREFEVVRVNGTVTEDVYTPSDYSLSSDGKTLTLKFSNKKLPSGFAAGSLKVKTVNTTTTQTLDTFGNPVSIAGKTVVDKIAPEVTDKFVLANVAGNQYTATFNNVTEGITNNVGAANSFITKLFSVNVTTDTGSSNDIVSIDSVNASGTTLVVTFTATSTIGAYDFVKVSLDSNPGAITDAAGNNLKTFTQNR